MHKNIVIYNTGYMTIKDSKYVKVNISNPLYLIINKVNGYFEEINRDTFLTLVLTNESKEIINKNGELWSKIRNLIRLITKISADYN